jgi:sodium/hydrogen antiporter
MKVSHRKGFIDRESYVAQYLALVFLTMGIASAIGTDDLLAAFAAGPCHVPSPHHSMDIHYSFTGSAISWDGHFNVQTEDDLFSTVIELLFNCASFVYIGAWLPFNSFYMPELGILPYRLILLFLSVLFLRRIPPLLLLYRWVPEIRNWKEALFSGHFGECFASSSFQYSRNHSFCLSRTCKSR